MAMLPIETTIQELERSEGRGNRVLSLYLLTDPSSEQGRNLHAQLSDMVRALAAQLGGEPGAGERVERELPAVRRYIETLGTPPRALAIFADSSRDFFHTLPLPVRVMPGAYWGATPYLRPLLTALDEYERTIVVLIDKERARFFRVFLQQITEIADVEDAVPAKHRETGGATSHTGIDWAQGGWARGGMQRHHEMHLLWHAKRAADALLRLAQEQRVDRVLIGGTPEMLAEFQRLVPRSLRGRIGAEVRVPMYAPASEVLAAVQEVEEQARRVGEERLVSDLLEQVGQGRAVFGRTEVLNAVNEQRAYLLAFREGARFAGSRCERCGLLTRAPVPARCPACGGTVRSVPDLVEELAERVLDQGGRVDEVRGPAAETLTAHGGIAALLRYVPAAVESATGGA